VIDSTTLYYFFSTVSQTVAGVIGLLGAFTVLRLSDLEGRVWRASTEIIEAISRTRPELASLMRTRNLSDALQHLNESDRAQIYADPGRASQLKEAESARDQALALKQTLYGAAKKALAMSGVAIAVSLVGILLAKYLESDVYQLRVAAIAAQGIILVLTAFSYWRLAKLTIGG
jgi:hypothetical protein